MIGNVQILKNNGDSLISNGLAHFILNSSQKQYIIYTLGEQNGNNLKAYIGLENAPVTDEGITKEEGETLYNLLKSIGKNEDVSSVVTFLPLTSGLYHIHDVVKKVAGPPVIINKVIEAQQQSQIKTTQEDEPVIKENTYFDQAMVEEPKMEDVSTTETSIFSQPMQPISDNSEGSTSVPEEAISSGEGYKDEETTTVEQNSALTTEEMITDEQAKNAIRMVEEAQKSIAENARIIKQYISQQKTLENQETFEVNSGTTIETATSLTSNANQSDEMISSEEKKDVVKDIELAPQPETNLDVLGEESELSSNYFVDASTQTTPDAMENVAEVASETAESGVVVSQEPISMIDAGILEEKSGGMMDSVEQEASIGDVQYIDTTSMIQTNGESTVNQQPDLGASEGTAKELESSYIDTTAMVQQPQVAENQYSGESMTTDQELILDTGIQSDSQEYAAAREENAISSEMIDTGATEQFHQQEAVQDASSEDYQQPIIQDSALAQGEIYSSTPFTNEQQNDGFANQMPEIEVQNTTQQLTSAENSFGQVTEQYITNGEQQPDYSENAVQFPAPEFQTVNNAGEYSVPPIDMSTDGGTVPEVVPVVLPTGQTQDVEQALVLTPEAFRTESYRQAA